jgi:hypothetical protein
VTVSRNVRTRRGDATREAELAHTSTTPALLPYQTVFELLLCYSFRAYSGSITLRLIGSAPTALNPWNPDDTTRGSVKVQQTKQPK